MTWYRIGKLLAPRAANAGSLVLGALLLLFLPAALAGAPRPVAPMPDPVKGKGATVSTVRRGDLVPPKVVQPCKNGVCPFAGQSVTVIVSNGVISWAIPELKEEFEVATHATLNIIKFPFGENFENFFSDAINRGGRYDASIAGAWWLGISSFPTISITRIPVSRNGTSTTCCPPRAAG